jgi:hypothetical protein
MLAAMNQVLGSALACGLFLTGCTSTGGKPTPPAERKPSEAPAHAVDPQVAPVTAVPAATPGASGGDVKSIGVATMSEDGTITLVLQAQGQGAAGDGRLVYPKSHPQYQEVLTHLGGMKPGEQKPVPPWKD